MTSYVRRAGRAVVVGATIAVAVSACLQNPNPTGGGGGAAGLGGYVDNGQTDGDKVVTVMGAFGGDEEKSFNASLADFTQRTGIKIQYVSDQDFTTTIKSKVKAGDSPDIGLFPQPGGIMEFAAQGKAQPIDTYLDYDALKSTLVPGFLDSVNYKGRVYAAPMRMAVKSIVWYNQAVYGAAGYSKNPATLQELAGITDQIKAGGTAPWCMGWESAQATGWVGTDWIEEYVLRLYGPEVYDQWIYHQIPFNDPRIVKAFDEVGKLIKTDGNVFGGARAILSTAFAKSMLPAFATPPSCMLERQGNFAITFFPTDIKAALDKRVGIFVFPKYEGGFKGQPILGGGDLAALFNGNDPDAQEVMKFLTSDKFGGQWAKDGGWLSPHKTFDQANYPDETTRTIAKMAYTADVFRFDGSDVMPKAVGSGSFWTGMVEWVNGTKTSQQVCDQIESGWPKS